MLTYCKCFIAVLIELTCFVSWELIGLKGPDIYIRGNQTAAELGFKMLFKGIKEGELPGWTRIGWTFWAYWYWLWGCTEDLWYMWRFAEHLPAAAFAWFCDSWSSWKHWDDVWFGVKFDFQRCCWCASMVLYCTVYFAQSKQFYPMVSIYYIYHDCLRQSL